MTLLSPARAQAILNAGVRDRIDPDLLDELRRTAAIPTRPDADAGLVGGPGDGRGPGVIPFGPNYRTVIVDSLGAVAIETASGGKRTGELALYLEFGGRINKRPDQDEGAYLLSIGQAAELIASITVAAQAGGRTFAVELERAIAREQARRIPSN
jgi:hypothetical protein